MGGAEAGDEGEWGAGGGTEGAGKRCGHGYPEGTASDRFCETSSGTGDALIESFPAN